MSDFKTKAYTGKDFVNILFERIGKEVDNIVVEIFLDGMKFKTILCEDGDSSLTLQPLAEGYYTYTVTQICGETVKSANGSFTILGDWDKGVALTY